MSCEALRPRLGEFLTGAVDEPTGQRVADHLSECEDCARELAALHLLEDQLRSLPLATVEPAPVASDPWPFRLGLLAAAAVALLAVGLAFLAPGPSRTDTARLLYGQVSSTQLSEVPRELTQPGPLAFGATIVVREEAVLELPGGTVVEAEPGAALELTGPRALRQEEGQAFFRVANATTHQPFVVHTPRGTVRVPGTSFRVEVRREPPMKPNATQAAGAVAVVAVAVISGVVMFDHGDTTTKVEAGHELVAGPNGVTVSPLKEAEQEVAEAPAEVERLVTEKAALEREKAELSEIRAKLESELKEARVELKALRETVPTTPEPELGSPPSRKMTVDFGGKWSEVEVLRNTEWKEMAQAVHNMIDLLTPETVSLLRQNKINELPPGVLAKISSNNGKLVQLALAISDEVPSHGATANGEYTHPIVLANLTAEHLALVGQPLSAAQQLELERLGREYDAAWEQQQTRYREDTLLLEKVLDELELKRAFVDAMQAELTQNQRKVVVREETHHVSGLDLYSPVLMMSGLVRIVGAESPDALRAKLVDTAVETWGFKKPELDNATAVFDTWLGNLGRELPPVPEHGMFTLDQCLVFGRAQLVAMKELSLRWTQEGDATRTKLLESPGLFIPGLKAAQGD